MATQDNDGDCLCSSLTVIGTICGLTDALIGPRILIGDGATMRTILAEHIAKQCAENALIGEGELVSA